LQHATLRLYLTGDVAIEHGDTLIRQARLGTRQARLVFARLAIEHSRLIPRQELADTLWGDDAPEGWDIALSAVISRLRSAIRGVQASGLSLDSEHGGYRMQVPRQTWIDVETAASAIDEAEGALRRNDDGLAWSTANVAVVIARRSFLPDEDGSWVEGQRGRLRGILRRGLHCLSAVSLRRGETEVAVLHATEAVAVERFNESGYRHLMETHARLGSRGEALRVYAQLRELLRDELGTSPSSDTESVYLSILKA
jgi:DNA-binding SARP family transcriptional activator